MCPLTNRVIGYNSCYIRLSNLSNTNGLSPNDNWALLLCASCFCLQKERVKDFKVVIIKYLESLVSTQQQVCQRLEVKYVLVTYGILKK